MGLVRHKLMCAGCLKTFRASYPSTWFCKRCQSGDGAGCLSVENFRRYSNRYNKLLRDVGVEFECGVFGFRLSSVTVIGNNARLKFDRSVKPGEHELVSIPLNGDMLLKFICEFANTANSTPTTINNTCGFHVHVDGRDLSIYDIRNLIILWYKFENEILDKLCHGCRKDARFATRWNHRFSRIEIERIVRTSHSRKLRKTILDLVYPDINRVSTGRATADIRRYNAKHDHYGNSSVDDQRRSVRYTSFNIHSWFYRRTIEYRYKEMTLDKRELIGWTMFCLWFTEIAERLTFKQTTKIYKSDLSLTGFVDQFMPAVVRNWVRDPFPIDKGACCEPPPEGEANELQEDDEVENPEDDF